MVVVRGVCTGIVGGPSHMRVEHLKAWLKKEKRYKDPITRHWETLVSITQLEFQEGHLPEAMNWTKMVLLPKGDGLLGTPIL